MGRSLTICGLLIVGTLAVYVQVVHFDFVAWDDPDYVAKNHTVQNGLTVDGVVWAFTTGHMGNWHPVTWLSHMLDCELYGSNAAGHHITSVLLHIMNVLLLFGLLTSMTGRLWPSGFVAALFALHPLHIESVAWVSERKDVLSTLFGLLAMWAYVAYVRRGDGGRYLLMVVFTAIGLMAKSMFVTLPLVLLLLDYWPLSRVSFGKARGLGKNNAKERPKGNRNVCVQRSIGYLLFEKIPLFALSVASSVVTLFAQRASGAMDTTEVVAIHLRLANAVVSYVRYLGKMIWPRNLSVFYPHPNLPESTPWSGWQIAGAAVLLAVISVLVIWVWRRRYPLVGWLWYLGTLVPVIGLVQVGSQAMADRYTYVPLVGPFIIIAWGGGELISKLSSREILARRIASVCGVAVLSACMVYSWSQVQYWRDSVSLYEHAIDATENNAMMHSNLGKVLYSEGKIEDAIRHIRQALVNRPHYAKAENNLGVALVSQGKVEEAIMHYRRALEMEPDYPEAHNNLASALQSQGKLAEAIEHYRQALQLHPSYAEAHYDLGCVLFSQGKTNQAKGHFSEAVRIKPGYADAHNNLGIILRSEGKLEDAIGHYREALKIKPDYAEAHNNLGITLASQGELVEGVKHFVRALELKPKYVNALNNLGFAFALQGKVEEAISQYREVLKIEPDQVLTLQRLSWILATYPDPVVHDADHAIELAERAAELTGYQNAKVIDTLAAAYAAAGHFEQAVTAAQKALSLAYAVRADELASQIRKRLELYRQGKPYQQAVRSPDVKGLRPEVK